MIQYIFDREVRKDSKREKVCKSLLGKREFKLLLRGLLIKVLKCEKSTFIQLQVFNISLKVPTFLSMKKKQI